MMQSYDLSRGQALKNPTAPTRSSLLCSAAIALSRSDVAGLRSRDSMTKLPRLVSTSARPRRIDVPIACAKAHKALIALHARRRVCGDASIFATKHASGWEIRATQPWSEGGCSTTTERSEVARVAGLAAEAIDFGGDVGACRPSSSRPRSVSAVGEADRKANRERG